MIRTIEIKNYKSIDQLELKLGRVNVFIGENGCGKSNILEAIGLAAASAANKLDNEFLQSRGIRVTSPDRMKAGFTSDAATNPIEIIVAADNASAHASLLEHERARFGGWTNLASSHFETSKDGEQVGARLSRLPPSRVVIDPPLPPQGAALSEYLGGPWGQRIIVEHILSKNAEALHLPEFLTYTPHEEALRDLARDSWIEPVGIHGEGLFALLHSLDTDQLAALKQQLALIHWFADLEILPGPNQSQRSLKIVDQYLAEGLTHFDQRSANEGFLFLLLYASLLISQHTPKFFAVDNVDASLNPKLAAGAVRMFVELSREHERQVLLTTHNPGTLDGLDLADDDQRLFVVYRDLEGRTSVHRVQRDPHAKHPVRLSEAFLRGYLGGLPDHF